MHEFTDQELLRRYAEHGADDAFAELVRRHCDLVWAAARRVSGDGEIARDVAQTVFTDLARKAGKLPAETVLAGWLYRAACHATANHIRGEARRAQREQQAMHQHELQATGAAERRAAEELQPVLDAALGDLAEADRDAVVLRYLAGRSLAEIGVTLGTSEDAAQKRVSRALEKLRDAFRQRGVDLTGGTVVAAMTLAGAQAAPAGLAASLASAALAAAGAVSGTTSILLLMKSKLAVGIVGGAVMATALVWQQRNVSRLAEENTELRQQIAVVSSAPPSATANSPAEADARELVRLREEHVDLMRLRGEVAQLRKQQEQLAALQRQSDGSKQSAEGSKVVAAIFGGKPVEEGSLNSVNALKTLGLAARIYSNGHQDRLPTTFDEMRKEMNEQLGPDGKLAGGISPDNFEFFPQGRVISEAEPQMILFREKRARQLTDGTWQRLYCMTDGSVRMENSPTSDFSAIERAGTATTDNVPKKP